MSKGQGPDGGATNDENRMVYMGKAINDAAGGLPAMLHDCNLAVEYVERWRVENGEQHRQRRCMNILLKWLLRLLMLYSIGSASFYLWASYRECIIEEYQMSENIFVYACSSILLLGIQGGKYFYWYVNETSAGGFEMRGPQIDNDRVYQGLSSLVLVLGVIQMVAFGYTTWQVAYTWQVECVEITLVRFFVASQIVLFGSLLFLIFGFWICGVTMELNLLPVQKLKKLQDTAKAALNIADMRRFEEKNNLTQKVGKNSHEKEPPTFDL